MVTEEMEARIKLPIKYCNRLAFTVSIVNEKLDKSMLAETKGAPISKDRYITIGINGGIVI